MSRQRADTLRYARTLGYLDAGTAGSGHRRLRHRRTGRLVIVASTPGRGRGGERTGPAEADRERGFVIAQHEHLWQQGWRGKPMRCAICRRRPLPWWKYIAIRWTTRWYLLRGTVGRWRRLWRS